MSVSGQAAATRVTSTAERLVELRARLDRLERGDPTTPHDVQQARARAASQERAVSVAQQRLMVMHRSAFDRHLEHVERLGSPERIESATQGQAARQQCHDALGRYRALAGEGDAELDLLKATLTAQFLWSGSLAAEDLDRRRGWCEDVVGMSAAREFAGWVHAVCVVAASVLPSVRGVSAVVATGGGAEVTAASDEWASQAQEVELIVGEGPSATARDRNRMVFVEDLGERDDWHGYASAIAGHGVRGVCAVPVRVHGVRAGSLTFYGSSTLEPALLSGDAAAFAQIAAAATAADVEAIRLGDNRRDAHFSVHVASGALASRLRITPVEAEARMRAHAFGLGLGLVDVAEQVLSGAVDLS